jgi:outer membrane beta-barrel protein
MILFACMMSLAAADDAKPDALSTEPAPATTPAAGKTQFQRVDERQPRTGTPLIADKLYPMQFRLEFTGMFDYSFNDKYVDHTGGHGAIGFHIFDWLAVEAFAGYLVGQETGIVANVRNDGSSSKRVGTQPCANPTCEPQLPDMWQTTWFTGADVQWAPIYGKISAVSEYDLNFQLYALAGGGVEGIRRQLNDGTFQDGSQAPNPFLKLPVRLSVNYGLGVRLIPWKWIAIRAEVRNYNGLNPDVQEHEARDQDACDHGFTLVQGADRQCYPDIYNNTMFQVGLSFLL